MQLVGTTFVLLAALRAAAANPVTITSVLTVVPVPMTIVHYPNATYTLKGTGAVTSAGRSGSNSTLQRTLPYQTTRIARTITTTMVTPSSSLSVPSPDTSFVEPIAVVTSSSNATENEPTSSVTSSSNATEIEPTSSVPSTSPNTTSINPTPSPASLPNAIGIQPRSPASTGPPADCTPNDLYCPTPSSYSFCAPAPDGPPRYIDMGAVAPGTLCADASIERASDGTCSPVGYLTCDDQGTKFFLCDEGGSLDMGGMASGTYCVNGQITVSYMSE